MASVPFAAALVALLACGDDGTDGGTDGSDTAVTGTFNGSMVIYDTNPLVAVNVSFDIASDGQIEGTTTPAGGAVGSEGTVSGKLGGDDLTSLDLSLELALPDRGTFALAGKCVFAESTLQLACPALTAKDEAGAFVGNAPLTASKDAS